MKFDEERVNTLPFARPDTVTRALIVRNDGSTPLTGRVRFWARFPVRDGAYPKPVTVRDEAGNVVPSRFTKSEISHDPALPVGRVWWECTLEWVATNVPARGWRTWGASFEQAPEPLEQSGPSETYEKVPLLPLSVVETECHPGDLPACFDGAQTQVSINP